MRAFAWIAVAAGGLGCASANLAVAPNMSSQTTPPSPYPAPTLADTGAVLPDPEPVFWSVSGSLHVSDNEVVAESSSLSFSVWADDAVLLCRLDAEVATSSALPLPDSGPLLVGWWRVSHAEGTPTDCVLWPAGDVTLGFGPYNPVFDPALAARGWLGVDVYGLYLQQDVGDPVFAVGVAGTSELFSGQDQPSPNAPVPDGVYGVQSLVLLDL